MKRRNQKVATSLTKAQKKWLKIRAEADGVSVAEYLYTMLLAKGMPLATS